MYAGHLGIALGASSLRRSAPLWILLIAAQLPDWLDAGLCVADASRGPGALYTHGLVTVGVAALLFGCIAWAITRDATAGLLSAALVLSHYPADLLTGLKPTWNGGPMLGLGLYAHPLVDSAVEGAVVLVGWLYYRRTLPPAARRESMMYAMLFVLLAAQLIAGIAFAFNVSGHVKC